MASTAEKFFTFLILSASFDFNNGLCSSNILHEGLYVDINPLPFFNCFVEEYTHFNFGATRQLSSSLQEISSWQNSVLC